MKFISALLIILTFTAGILAGEETLYTSRGHEVVRFYDDFYGTATYASEICFRRVSPEINRSLMVLIMSVDIAGGGSDMPAIGFIWEGDIKPFTMILRSDGRFYERVLEDGVELFLLAYDDVAFPPLINDDDSVIRLTTPGLNPDTIDFAFTNDERELMRHVFGFITDDRRHRRDDTD